MKIIIYLILCIICITTDRSIYANNSAHNSSSSTLGQHYQVLIFTRTAGFRHASIEAGIQSIKSLGEAHGFQAETSEDAAIFNDVQLANYRVVIFLNTTGDILNPEQEAAFEGYIHAGGGFVGIHSATDTEYTWPWYRQLIGAQFLSHPPVQDATIQVIRKDHLSTIKLPSQWERTDEWYNFRDPLPSGITVLAKLDETSYSGGSMGAEHPISWAHEFEGGRAWYTAMGHTGTTFQEPLFLEHLLGGIQWAAGNDLNRHYLALVVH